MDTLETMRLLVRVVERRSFTQAASDLGLPRSTVTEAIKHLEARLGVRLLQRTTRLVAPTLEGEVYYRRCVAIIADIEEAEGAIAGAEPKGQLRIDVHGNMARLLVLPKLPDFLDRYPGLALHIGEGDRLVDLVRENVDCVIRAGEPAGSQMIVRRLGSFQEITVASPSYLERYGIPDSPGSLHGHQMIGFVSSATGQVMPLEFTEDGKVSEVLLPARITTTSSDTAAMLAQLGYGLVQAPRHRFTEGLESGAFQEVLAGYRPRPTPVSIFYPHNRHLSRRVRVFVDWVAGLFADKKP
jgi:DNA-binding transcriptional LysR family regulator